jgi:cell division protein FtsL
MKLTRRNDYLSGIYFIPTLIVLAIAVVGMLMVKNKVQDLNRKLNIVNAKIIAEKEGIHVLQAELAFLSNPKRIKSLSDKHLEFKAPQSSQVLQLKDLGAYITSMSTPSTDECQE